MNYEDEQSIPIAFSRQVRPNEFALLRDHPDTNTAEVIIEGDTRHLVAQLFIASISQVEKDSGEEVVLLVNTRDFKRGKFDHLLE